MLDLSQLNPPQLEAVMHYEGPLLVLAGAGSGKTRVVTYRTAKLISLGVSPKRILVVTFTNKAAQEMRERVEALVGKDGSGDLTMTTFHALGARLLRQYITRLGFKRNFTILDYADQVRLVKSTFEELGMSRSSVSPGELLRLVSLAKRSLTTPARLPELRFSQLMPHAQRVFKSYQAHLRAMNAVDFDDLIALPIKLCDEHDGVRALIGKRFDFVMVDEFQDTNATQLALVKRVTPHHNLVAVGDDDQSIYAFQGAVASNVLDFERDFPGAKMVVLEQNYRSTSLILEAANAVIANNGTRHKKVLWSDRDGGAPIQFVLTANERVEVTEVAKTIEREYSAGKWRYEDVAILYRTNGQAALFEEALRLAAVPFHVVGGTELFDRSEVRDWLAYLAVLMNSHDDLRLRRVLNVPRRGLGPKAVEVLEDDAERRGGGLMGALRRAHDNAGLSPVARQGAHALVSLLKRWREPLVEGRGPQLASLAGGYLEATGLLKHFRRAESTVAAGNRRVRTLLQLVEGMRQLSPSTSLDKYLAGIVLDTQKRKDSTRATGVTLMTLHSAKGLEFPRVFLVGFERELLPHKNALANPSAIAEERRLCYVGMTRAKDKLTLTAARTRTKRGERVPRHPSQFLDEIPPSLMERLERDRSDDVEPAQDERAATNKAAMSAIYAMLGKEKDASE